MAIIHYFKTVLDHLESVRRKCSDQGSESYVRSMEMWFRLVRTFYVCMTKFGQCLEHCESAGLLIEDALPKCASKIQSLCFRLLGDDQLTLDAIKDDLQPVVMGFLKSIQFFKKKIEELYLICSNNTLQRAPFTADDLMDLINPLLEILQDQEIQHLHEDLKENLDALQANVRFLKNLIQFATLRGLQHTQMEHLLTLTQGFVINASLLASISFDGSAIPDVPGKISELIRTVKPVEHQVHEIYVHVLLASMSSPSSHTPTPTPASCKTMLGDFIDSLKYNLLQLLNLSNSSLVSLKYQMLKMHEALIFLKAIMREQQNKFEDLYETSYDLPGVVICEAGIVICSLFMETNERGLVKDLDSMFANVFNKIKLIQAEATEIDPITSELSFPRTNMLGLVDSILEKLKSFSPYEADSVAFAKDQLQIVQEGLEFLRTFLDDVKVHGEQLKKFQTLRCRVGGVAYQIEFILDSLVVEDTLCGLLVLLNSIIEEIKLIKSEALENFTIQGHVVEVQKVSETSRRLSSVSDAFTDHVVGFDKEAKEILDKLLRGTKKLDIISILGMPGKGKTTLAKKVYHDPSISKHFQFCSWCTISQEYNKNDLLSEILQSHVTKKEIDENKDDLAGLLRKCLKGRTYLIILDDIWDCGAWYDLRISFPDDSKQSRILLTSRHNSVASQIGNKHHDLRLLNDDESWELLQKKVFDDKGCPEALGGRGKRIAGKCKGLPLTIVLVAGILANAEPDDWAQVEDHLSETCIDQCKKVLELSYCHLPEYLKSCFLYFGIFKEDQQVPIQKLLFLWIAEGFIEKSDKKCVEHVAEGYMMELIGRNLVTSGRKASTGKVKTCSVHDLLREFCVAKGKEEQFCYWLQGKRELHTFNEPAIVHRLCVCPRRDYFAKSRQVWPYLRSLMVVNDDDESNFEGYWRNILYILRQFKLLRVLDLTGIHLGPFPSEIESFIHLRYLAIRCLSLSVLSLLDKLENLETLVLQVDYLDENLLLPKTLWNMKKLRHLCVVYGWWELPEKDLQNVSSLENLHTLSWVIISSEKVLQKFPCLRELKCQFNMEIDGTQSSKIISLDSLSQLESLHLKASGHDVELAFQFPLNLRKLVLSELFLPWSKISAIAELPNLEVLKLREKSFLGDTWDMGEVRFSALRFFKLESLDDLVSWAGSGDHFPCLQRLELRYCKNLKELPSCLEYISTLEMIHVSLCESARRSIEELREMLEDLGNGDVKIVVID